MWLLAHGRLRTKDAISYEPNKICSLCKTGDESIDHLFFGFPVMKVLWKKVKAWLHMHQQMSPAKRMLHVFYRSFRGNGRLTKARYLAMSCMVFLIWQARNKCLYKGDSPNIDKLFCKI